VTPALSCALADAYGFSNVAQGFVMGAAAMGLVWAWASVWRAWGRACIASLRRARPSQPEAVPAWTLADPPV